MVGPVVKISPDDLPRRPNIHWLGQQSYELLPQLVASWYVCLLPFAINDSTRFISPTKTLEYMAAQKPVVSTPVRDVSVLYGQDVCIADSKESFVAACRDLLAEASEDRLRRTGKMAATVARYSWDNTAETIRLSIDNAITESSASATSATSALSGGAWLDGATTPRSDAGPDCVGGGGRPARGNGCAGLSDVSIDALVIGGGPAGLMAAIYLARFRRSVTLVDADQSRLAKLPRTHNYPGFADGIVGPQLLLNLRQQASRYAIQFEAGTVDQLERAGSDFRVAWPGGAVRTRCVLLARGAVDVEPTMLHLAGALRDGAIRYCPVCDGFEVIDQAVGVIADGPKGVAEALYLRTFTDRVTLFMEKGDATFSDGNGSVFRRRASPGQPLRSTASGYGIVV